MSRYHHIAKRKKICTDMGRGLIMEMRSLLNKKGSNETEAYLRLMSGLIREQIVEVTDAGFRYRVLDESLGLNFTPWNFKFPCRFHEGRVAFAEAAPFHTG